MTTAHSFSGTAVRTTLASSMSSGTTTMVIADATGWPDTTSGPFTVTIGANTSAEEKVLVTARSTTTCTVTRGYDGTTGVAHASGEAAEHTISAVDIRQAVLGTSGPYCKATRGSFSPGASLGTVTWTTISGTDSLGGSPPQSSITVPRTGLYLVTFSVATPSSGHLSGVQLRASGVTTYDFPYDTITAKPAAGAMVLVSPTSVELLVKTADSASVPSAELVVACIQPFA